MRAALLAGCALAGALAGTAMAQPGSPVGDWDIVVTGSQQGVAFLHFESDFTIHGWEAVTHRQALPSTFDPNQRGDTTPAPAAGVFYFIGYTPVTGSWNFATSGRIIGNLTQDEVALTGGYSFNGVAHPGRNLVLNVLESPNPTSLDHRVRHTTWGGVPLAAVPLGVTPGPVDLSGTWLAQGSVTALSTNGATSTQYFTELLTLKSLTGGDPTGFFTDLAASPFAAQSYVITGTGPGYTNVGVALQSSKKRLSVVLREGDFTSDITILRAVDGPLNTNKFTSNLVGTDDNASIVKYRLQRTVTD